MHEAGLNSFRAFFSLYDPDRVRTPMIRTNPEKGRGVDPKFVLGYFNNYTFSAPGGQRWEEALKKISFVTHITTHISEFSWYSDLILPAPHFVFERWGIQKSAGNRHTQVGISQPVVLQLLAMNQSLNVTINTMKNKQHVFE